MAGVKGRSGGAREGAGRKPDVAELPHTDDPLQFLLNTMNDGKVPIAQRVRAAVAAAQYKHTKRADGGKKEEAAAKAAAAGAGRFKPEAPPKLVVNNR